MLKDLSEAFRRLFTVAFALIATCVLSTSESGLAQPAEDLLPKLQFENSGTVTRDMDFRYFSQPDDYLGTSDVWTIPSVATYLYRVNGSEKRPVGI